MKEDILFLVADNTNTNPATADLLDVPFIGCASHRFNLAVQKYLEQHQNVITNIHRIMVLLSNLKKAGKLRQFTDLEPVTMNATRWTSKYAMIERYFQLEEYIKEMNDAELDILLPSGRELAQLKTIQNQLSDFNLITLKLQDTSISLLEVRLLFDEAISCYPSMEFHLAEDARIVKHPSFESAIRKVLSQQQILLSDEERRVASRFVLQTEEIVEMESQTILQRALKRRRTQNDEGEKYCD
jgi:hypothetical protein